jgi:ornithine lipid ester-linked acyl 2-hydroxylase
VTDLPASAFKILTGAEWTAFQAAGRFDGSPADRADGFIHLSAKDQVEGTLARHYAGQNGLILAEIDLGALGDRVRWEESRGGALFPHAYGTLPLSAVRATTAFP